MCASRVTGALPGKGWCDGVTPTQWPCMSPTTTDRRGRTPPSTQNEGKPKQKMDSPTRRKTPKGLAGDLTNKQVHPDLQREFLIYGEWPLCCDTVQVSSVSGVTRREKETSATNEVSGNPKLDTNTWCREGRKVSRQSVSETHRLLSDKGHQKDYEIKILKFIKWTKNRNFYKVSIYQRSILNLLKG